jgi:hypothetical protein
MKLNEATGNGSPGSVITLWPSYVNGLTRRALPSASFLCGGKGEKEVEES